MKTFAQLMEQIPRSVKGTSPSEDHFRRRVAQWHRKHVHTELAQAAKWEQRNKETHLA